MHRTPLRSPSTTPSLQMFSFGQHLNRQVTVTATPQSIQLEQAPLVAGVLHMRWSTTHKCLELLDKDTAYPTNDPLWETQQSGTFSHILPMWHRTNAADPSGDNGPVRLDQFDLS